MSFSEFLASLKTFTWVFSIRKLCPMVIIHHLTEDGARQVAFELFSKITEKNKNYVLLEKQRQCNIQAIEKLRLEKRELENDILRYKDCLRKIQKAEAEYNHRESNEKYQTMANIYFYEPLEEFYPLYTMEGKIKFCCEDIESLEKKNVELYQEMQLLEESIETSILTGEYNISPIDLTLDLETDIGKTLQQVLEEQPQIDSYRSIIFCT